jgi:hypothetical protein
MNYSADEGCFSSQDERIGERVERDCCFDGSAGTRPECKPFYREEVISLKTQGAG